MWETLLSWDTNVFQSINRLPHTPFTDTFFGSLTLLGYFGIGWVLYALFLVFRKKDNARNIFLSLSIGEVISFLIADILIKNIVKRLRPEFLLHSLVLPFNFAQSYSFPSGHAAASFVAAYLLSKKDKKRAWVYYVVALLISFSRIYLGKHYPSDVLAGALIGTLIGWGIEIGMLKLYAKKK